MGFCGQKFHTFLNGQTKSRKPCIGITSGQRCFSLFLASHQCLGLYKCTVVKRSFFIRSVSFSHGYCSGTWKLVPLFDILIFEFHIIIFIRIDLSKSCVTNGFCSWECAQQIQMQKIFNIPRDNYVESDTHTQEKQKFSKVSALHVASSVVDIKWQLRRFGVDGKPQASLVELTSHFLFSTRGLVSLVCAMWTLSFSDFCSLRFTVKVQGEQANDWSPQFWAHQIEQLVESERFRSVSTTRVF